MKAIWSCRQRKQRLSRVITTNVGLIGMSEMEVARMTTAEIRQQLRELVTTLKEVQRDAVKLREQWLEEMAMRNALAYGDADSQKLLKTMLRKIHTQAMDSKINRITNGERVGLDYIEIHKGEWFLSRINGELFR